jgi:hypothetical protein
MPQIRAEQIRSLSLKDAQIAIDANVVQSKILTWQDDLNGWITKGIVKLVSTASNTPDPSRPGHYYPLVPTWNGTQAGSLYYVVDTDELFVGTSQTPYFNLLVCGQTGNSSSGANWESVIVVKDGSDAIDFANGYGTTIQCDTNISFALDASDMFVYVNGILQEYGAADNQDFHVIDSRTIKFEYNLIASDKITFIIMNNNDFVNYTTKAYLGSTYSTSGASHVGVMPIGNLAANDVQDALEELQTDIDMLTGGQNLIFSLDNAYEDGSTIYVDTTDMDFNLTNHAFNISDNSGSAPTATYMDVMLGNNQSVSSITGLSVRTTYSLTLNSTAYSIITGTDTTYSSLLSALNLAVPSQIWSLASGNLRCSSRILGDGGRVVLGHGSTNPDLFNALTAFVQFGVQNLGSNSTASAPIFQVTNTPSGNTISVYQSILPQGSGINLGSATNKWGNVYASEGHFDTSTVYLGSNIISVQSGKLVISNDGTTYGQIAQVNIPGAPTTLSALQDQNLNLTSTGQGILNLNSANEVTVTAPLTKFNANVEIDGNIIPTANETTNIGSDTNRINSIYASNIYFRPLAQTTEFAGIYTQNTNGGTLIHHQIGNDNTDQIIFESNNGSVVNQLLVIDGGGNVNIPGNLIVSGTTTTVNSTNTNLKDSTLTIKYNNIGIDGNAAIDVRRAKNLTEGDRDAFINWSDSIARWTLTYGAAGNISSSIVTAADIVSAGAAANSTTANAIFYAGNASQGATGTFDAFTSAPTATQRLNYNGNLYATGFYGPLIGAVTGNVTGNITGPSGSAFTVSTTAQSLTLSTSTSGAINVTSAGNLALTAASALTLKDSFLSAAIPLSQTGTTALVGFTSTSIVGALNEIKGQTPVLAGTTTTGSVKYNGTTALAAAFDGGTTAPLAASTNRLNYSGDLYVNDLFTTSNVTVNGNLAVTGTVTLDNIPLTQPSALSLTSTFAYNSQVQFNWTTRGTGQSAITSILGATNANRQDLWEYVELISTTGASVGIAAGANLVGAKGIVGIIPTGKTAGADGSVQQVIEGMSAAMMTTVGASTIGSVLYNGTTSIAGAFDGGTTTPTATTRLNYNGNLYATNLSAGNVNLTSGSINLTSGNLAITSGNITISSGIFTATGSQGSLTFNAHTGGGTFSPDLQITNSTVSKTKSLRVNSSGALETMNSAYTTVISTLDDSGNLSTAGTITIGSAGALAYAASAPTLSGTAILGYNGYFYANRVYNAVWNDLAEFMPTAIASRAGDVLVMTSAGVVPSTKRAQKSVVGVHSDTFGYALGAEAAENKTAIGLSGRVKVKVKEVLEIGDLLVSDVDGFASKATTDEELRAGIIIGKVMEDKTDSVISRIWMLILNR